MVYYSEAEESVCIEASHILACLAALTHNPNNHCQIRNIMEEGREQIHLLMDNGDSCDMKSMKGIIAWKENHDSCKQCCGRKIVKQLLLKCKNK